MLKKRYLKKANAQECAFFDSLSDLKIDLANNNSYSSSSDDESERMVMDMVTRLLPHRHQPGWFLHHGTWCQDLGGNDSANNDDSVSKVSLSADELVAKVERSNTIFHIQHKLLKHTARERNDFKANLESALKDLRVSMVVLDEIQCDSCAIYMSNLATYQTKYACLIDECDEFQSRSSFLGVSQSCLALQLELA